MSELGRGRAPTYVTINDHVIYEGISGNKILPAHSFIRPIDWYYVPTHVMDDTKFKYANKEKEIICYTRYGMILLSRDNVTTI